jgi:hypothetical protein
MLDPTWNYKEVQDFDCLNEIFNRVDALGVTGRRDHYVKITEEMKAKLGLPCVNMAADQSQFWKKYYSRLHRNRGIMDLA